MTENLLNQQTQDTHNQKNSEKIKNNLEDIAYLTLHYNSNKIMHISCSWISPVKIRRMLIGGDKKMVLFNDLETTEKIKIYDHKQFLTLKSNSEVSTPKVSGREALNLMAEDFINAISDNSKPISNYELGLHVVKILEAAQTSIKNNGKIVLI